MAKTQANSDILADAKSNKTAPKGTTELKSEKKKKKVKPHRDCKWYVLYAQSNYENKVCEAIQQRVEATGMEKFVPEIFVPVQKKIVVKNGKQTVKNERIFPGYVLIKMKLDEDTWTIISNTEGVRGFVKTDKYPRPLPEKEVKAIMQFMEVETPAYQSSFNVGEAVKINDGPFADFIGSISEIDDIKGKIKVMISFLGREAPVDLEFSQIEKL